MELESTSRDCFNEFYYSTVCHVCKTKSDSLKTCKGCRLYRYCSIHHQKAHWKTHKALCKALSKFNDSCFCLVKNDWFQTRIHVKNILEHRLHRELTPAENQIWMFPRACAVCYKTNSEFLFDCSMCPGVSYCSLEHQSIHRKTHIKLCPEIQLQYDYYCSRLNGDFQNTQLNVNISFEVINDIFLNKNKLISKNSEYVQKIYQGDKLSHALSILKSMQKCGLMSGSKVSKEQIIIHIVGATYEYNNFNKYVSELLFHWVCGLKSLSLVFVGPELEKYSEPEWIFCSSCQKKDVQVSYYFESTLYSDYVSMSLYVKPDIIAIFNCGFHEFSYSSDDLWGGSLPFLLMPGIPLLITSYTYDESVQDLHRLRQFITDNICINVLVNCEKNEFCSPLPLRDWVNMDDVYFNNNYFTLIKSHLMKST